MISKANQKEENRNLDMHFRWELCQVLSGASDLKTVSKDFLKLIQQTFRPAKCTLIIMDPKTKRPVIRARTGMREKAVRFYGKKNNGKAFDIEEGVAEVAETKGSNSRAAATATKKVSPASREEDDSLQIGSTLSVPLISNSGLVGVLNLLHSGSDSRRKDMKQTLLFSSEWIAEQIEVIVARVALEKEHNRIKETLKEKERIVEDVNALLETVEDALMEREASINDMEKQLVDVKQFSESVLQSLSSGIISVDQKGKISYMNKGAEKILRFTFKEITGRPLSKAFTLKEKELDFFTKDRVSEDQALGREKTLVRKDGLEIPIGFTISSHLDLQGKEIGKIIHFRDLTEINKMQEEILRMDRLISLGEISMGIAHEIRNPLAGIRITAQAMDEEIDSGDSRKEYSGRIISEIDRLNDLLKSFFSFARPKNPDFSFCHIQEITQEVHLLIKKDLSDRDIDFVQDFGKGIPRLKVDFNQMKQVFLNLLLNSIHAMPLGGQLRVACTLNESRQKTDKRKRHAEITISDTGNGIDKQNILRIFDPFFTTKAKGLGLGLSITYRIIKKHGGNITVQSKKDEGTSFRITLPIDYEGDYFI